MLALAHDVGGKQLATADRGSGNLTFMTTSGGADVDPQAVAALALSEMVRVTVPRLKELADAYLPQLQGVLGRIFSELMVSMVGLFHLVEDAEAAEVAQEMVGLMRPLVDLLGDGSQPRAAVGPRSPSQPAARKN